MFCSEIYQATCDSHSEDALWVRKFMLSGPFDVFEPDLVHHALENADLNLGLLIFGGDLWSQLCAEAHLNAPCLSNSNVLAQFYALL